MQVKAGYKHTEVGMIPTEWDVRPLDKFVSLHRGHDLPERYRRPGEVPVMGSAGPNGFHDTAIVRGPGVLLGRSGASFGQAHYSTCDYWPHNTALYVTDFHGNHPLFAFYFLKGIDFTRHNSGGAQQSLNRNFIAPILAAFPRRAEQVAIAEALSDVDALIESLEQLLTKKRQIKKGAMQELLTGKKRLSGYSGEWEVKRLGEFVSIRNQKALPSGLDVDTLCIELDHIGQGDGRLFGYSAAQYSTSSKYRFCFGDVLFGRLRSYLRKFWLADRNGICSTEIWPLMVDPEQARSDFLYAIVQSDEFIATANISYGTHMPRADWDIVRNFSVSLPKPKEQSAIATILSDMDAEITALEAKLSKARQLKQGMMQELLTGRIRLL